jgi:rSAM/selenodomain-associated transferase 1
VSTAVIVFAREPSPGKVKTRLAKDIGASAAARVYAALLAHALREACTTDSQVVLSLAEPLATGSTWSPPPGVAVELQAGRDLGARMANAFARRFDAGASAVALVGSDVPLLNAGVVAHALEECGRHDVVLVPAHDGGYVLVAQHAPGVDLFTGVPWSSPDTLVATRGRLRALGVGHVELEPLGDLDSLEDLRACAAVSGLDTGLRRCFSEVLARLESARGVP